MGSRGLFGRLGDQVIDEDEIWQNLGINMYELSFHPTVSRPGVMRALHSIIVTFNPHDKIELSITIAIYESLIPDLPSSNIRQCAATMSELD